MSWEAIEGEIYAVDRETGRTVELAFPWTETADPYDMSNAPTYDAKGNREKVGTDLSVGPFGVRDLSQAPAIEKVDETAALRAKVADLETRLALLESKG